MFISFGYYWRMEWSSVETTLLAVRALQATVCSVRTVLVYVLQQRNRRQWMRLIRTGHRIHVDLCSLNGGNSEEVDFVDQRVHRMAVLKCGLLIGQTISVCAVIVLQWIFTPHRILVMFALQALVTHGMTVVFSAMYAIVLLAELQLMRKQRGQLVGCMRRVDVMAWSELERNGSDVTYSCAGGAMRIQQFGDLSDRVDALNAIFDRLTDLVRELTDMFGVQLLLTLLNASVSVLTQVRW